VDLVRNVTAQAGRQIAAELGLDDVAFLDQVHGGDVLACDAAGQAGSADGLVTARKGLGLLGKSGDCPIVLIADRRYRATGFAHASWRATVAGIVPNTVGRLVALGCTPSDLVACICPSAGPECYEVGPEVRTAALDGIGAHAAAYFHPGPRGRDHFDLWAANVDALKRGGVPAQSIHVAGVCTLCRHDQFPSHRREGDTAGRFAAVIGLPA
jgi:YfiH family protein